MVYRFGCIMSCKRDWFDTYHEINNGGHIYLGDNKSHEIKGYGDISVMMPNGQEIFKMWCMFQD